MTTSVTLSAQPTLALPDATAKGPPTAFRILRAGVNTTDKGTFLFDAEAAEAVMAAYTAKGLDKIQCDFEHQSMQPPPAGGPAHKPAAGWFRPEIRGGELWAVDVVWTADAAAMLAPASGAPAYRYFSPILRFDEATRRITALRNLALTNDPAMDGLEPLMAARAGGESNPTRQGDRMLPMHAQKTVTLTAADRQAARMLGTDLAELEAFKQQQAEDAALEQGGIVALSGLPGTVELTASDIQAARMLGNSIRDVVEFKLKQQAAAAERQRLGLAVL